jgi:homoserine O-acetyltransferase/O-succinyltransferase
MSEKSGTISTKISSKFDLPGSEHSVGWTVAKHCELASSQKPFKLECGGSLEQLTVEYETYGTLAPARDNVILICHALSGDAHVAGWDVNAKNDPRLSWRQTHPGWWDAVIGPGKPIDTTRFFVVCANVLGSCYGTTGPQSIDPATGKQYGLRFPMVTVSDWVRMEHRLIAHLGIDRLYAVIGGSLGGQQALEWSLRYPEMVGKCIIMASGPKLPAQGLGFNAVARHAIMHDVSFAGGDYYEQPVKPDTGLAVARMLAHITYLSGKGMDFKFGRRRVNNPQDPRCFGIEFDIEGYLNHQSQSFVQRFDANSYLYITRAMDYYDAASQWCSDEVREQYPEPTSAGADPDYLRQREEAMLTDACRRIKSELMVVSFSSDWLYPPSKCRDFVNAFIATGRPVTYVEIQSDSGHDAFLVDTTPVGRLLRAYLRDRGINRRFSTIK